MLPIDQIPARLRQAREVAGLELQHLSLATGLPVPELSALESGKAPLTATDSNVIARALGLEEQELLGVVPPAPTAVGALLRGSPAEASDLESHLGRFASIARVRAKLTGMLGWQSTVDLDGFEPAGVPGHPAWRGAERLALDVRTQLGLAIAPVRSLVDVVDELLGIHLLWTRSLSKTVRGLTLIDERRYGRAIIINLAFQDFWAQRSTIAHELCHALFDRSPGKPIGVVSRAAVGGRPNDDLEQRANAFACYFLVPRAGAKRYLSARGIRPKEPIDKYIVHGMANHFGVGIDLLTGHLLHLEQIDEGTRHDLVRQHYPFDAALDTESPDRRENLALWTEAGVDVEHLCLVGPVVEALERNLVTLDAAKEILGLTPFDSWPGHASAGHS